MSCVSVHCVCVHGVRGYLVYVCMNNVWCVCYMYLYVRVCVCVCLRVLYVFVCLCLCVKVMKIMRKRTYTIPADDPRSKTSIDKAEKIAARTARRLAKATLERCTTPEDRTCCNTKDCVHVFKPELTLRLQTYLASQSFEERRTFVAQRVVFDGFNRPEIRKNSRLLKYFMESPELLDARLKAANLGIQGRTRIPEPQASDLIPVCVEAFLFMSSIANGFVYQHCRRLAFTGGEILAEDRKVDPQRLRAPVNRQSPVKERAVSWLRTLSEIATVLPNCTRGFKILPYRTPKALHAIYVREMEIQNKCAWINEERANYDATGGTTWDAYGVESDTPMESSGQNVSDAQAEIVYRYGNKLLGKKGTLPTSKLVACFSYFSRVWQEDPIAKLCRCRAFMPFAKCDTCVAFRAKDMECQDQAEKSRLRDAQANHLKEVKIERAAYYTNRTRGQTNPDEYLSMIIDGANQSQHAVPHAHEKSHVSDKAWKLQLHLMGVIVHGRGTWAYTCPPHIAQGNNTTIQALWDTICDIFKKEGKLPRTLYLQLDNTTKQCKGRYVFGFLGLLVEMGVFDKVIVGFLPVGHTHEDIDQFFSRIAVFMRSHSAFTREQFGKCVENSYTKNNQKPIVRHWDAVANISDWMKKKIGKVSGLMGFRHFKIIRVVREDREPEVRWMCRDSPGSVDPQDTWRGPVELSSHVDLFPTGAPDLLADAKAAIMPPCKRSTANQHAESFAKMLEKVNAGLKMLRENLHGFTDEHFYSCKALAEMVGTPLGTPIPFNWALQDIADLAEYRMVDDSAPVEVQSALVETPFAHRTGDFLLLRPGEGEPKPFYLAKIVLKVTLPDGRMAVRLCYYEHEHDHLVNQDVYAGCYEPSTSHFKKPVLTLPLLTIWNSPIQAKILMRAPRPGYGGGYRLQISEQGLKTVKYWVRMFTCGDEYDVQHDD
jgi:hypothetical protein